jgi:hypothetical protein
VSKSVFQFLSRGALAAGLLAASAALAPSQAQSAGPFAGLEGAWSGTGTIQVADGGSERIRCKANYTVASQGNQLQQALRCASDSYRFDLNSDVISRSGNLTGTWSETSRNINGGIEGKAGNGQFRALVTANGFAAELSMIAKGNKQTISISSENTQLKGVQITLAR